MTTITEDVAATSEEIAPATENGAAKGDFSAEVAEWVEAFDEVVAIGRPQAVELLEALRLRGRETGVVLPYRLSTRFRNTIPAEEEVAYPGDMEMERRIKSLIRWNAMAMVHGQNKKTRGSAGTFRPTRRWRRCWRWVTATSSTRSTREKRGTSCRGTLSTFRDTRRRGFTQGRTWRGG